MVNILLTGAPRSGKTTLINSIVIELGIKVIGFFTKEIREDKYRIGFEIETYSGHKKILASKKNYESQYKVSNYGVYLDNLNHIIKHLDKERQMEEYEYIIIDEIGKMELFS